MFPSNHTNSQELRVLCLTYCPREIIQNFPYSNEEQKNLHSTGFFRIPKTWQTLKYFSRALS